MICLLLEKGACTENLHSLVLSNENQRSFKPSVVLILRYKDDEEAEKQNKLSCFCGVNTQKGVHQRLKDVTQTQQQRYELPMVTLAWHVSKHKVHKSTSIYSHAR